MVWSSFNFELNAEISFKLKSMLKNTVFMYPVVYDLNLTGLAYLHFSQKWD